MLVMLVRKDRSGGDDCGGDDFGGDDGEDVACGG